MDAMDSTINSDEPAYNTNNNDNNSVFLPPLQKSNGHTRSVSHGGVGGTLQPFRPSALKKPGHRRVFSQGGMNDSNLAVCSEIRGHRRTGSKPEFILPHGHEERRKKKLSHRRSDSLGFSFKSHSRQASRTDSVYTIRAPLNTRDKVFSFNFLKKTPEIPTLKLRAITPNHCIPDSVPRHEHPNHQFLNNKVRTTKYTFWSFIPKNLFEQFHRFANLYFLFIVLLNWVPSINAFGKEVSMIPVVFVLGFTAIKDIFEDRRRYLSDKKVNNNKCRVYNVSMGRYIKCEWKNLRVGDIVHLSCNEPIPADILLLRTSDEQGICYIDTQNLDGETNLKLRCVPVGFKDKQTSFQPQEFRANIECDMPTTKIYQFNGVILHPWGERVPIGKDNLLLRECILKNTDFVEGIVVYAGHESKAMLNNDGPRHKRSDLERKMNREVLRCVVILIVMCFIGAVGSGLWLDSLVDEFTPFITVLKKEDSNPPLEGFQTFWTFVIILQVIIPMSLYVTIEMCKLLQVYLIHNDPKLYDELYSKNVECRALNIPEELGQIQYIFCDKTGTLTDNKMLFKRCTIDGQDYAHNSKLTEKSIIPMNESLAVVLKSPGSLAQDFFLILALCNTVIVSKYPHRDRMNGSGLISNSFLSTSGISVSSNDSVLTPQKRRFLSPLSPIMASSPETSPNHTPHFLRPKTLQLPSLFSKLQKSTSRQNSLTPTSSPDLRPIYEAESPDELALIDAAYAYNVRLLSRSPNHATLSFPNFSEPLNCEILHVLPFDSTRKRMSVILRHPLTNELTLYTKGADSSMLNRLCDSSDVRESIQSRLDDYAQFGLRVLLMAKRCLSVLEYSEWLEKHVKAEMSLSNREELLSKSYDVIESQLVLVGASGIEDRLQDGVPETIYQLRAAGIVVWVLTGDKQETAINIAYSCRLFSPNMSIILLNASSKDAAEALIHHHLEAIASAKDTTLKRSSRALVVDGTTLIYILDKRTNLQIPFLTLTSHCSSVLGCRTTPLQKAFIVRIVKERLGMKTLAIGDGANDVSMIQTADVGIGISGQEGMQAVMSSDFAISRFKYLERLLLVHGHWNYDRLSRMILYFFYKNAAFVFVSFWFQLFCGFSGSVMIDVMYLMLYNLIFTSLPPLAIGVYDQDVPEWVLLSHPFLYAQGRSGLVYRPYSFWINILDALYQSIAIFFIAYLSYQNTDVDIWEFGTTICTSCLFVNSFHLAIEVQSWTIIHWLSLVLSILAYFIFAILYNGVCVDCFGITVPYWVIQHAMSTPQFWLVILLSSIVSLIPRLFIRSIRNTMYPSEMIKLKNSLVNLKIDSIFQMHSPRDARRKEEEVDECSTEMSVIMEP